jgi:hypothetical protein
MYIFIDESGVFLRDPRRADSISCVGSVIVPGRHLSELERQFRVISAAWPRSADGELKGRLLSEEHIAAVCSILEPLHVLTEFTVVDMNFSEDADVDHHQRMQAEGMTAELTPEHHPNVVTGAWALRRRLEEMPRQLYAQAVALTDLVCKACENGQNYFCQRYPGELGSFRWMIDAKDREKLTPYEEWWRGSVLGLLQSRSLREPFHKLRGGDYSAFYRNFPAAPIPAFLRPHVKRPVKKGDDLRGVFARELKFGVSSDHIGLQIADILTNALRRALSQRLQPAGWRPIGKLMIHRKGGAIVPMNFGSVEGKIAAPYAPIANELNRMGRSMLIEKNRHRRRPS